MPHSLEDVARELAPILGGRIQRVDLVAEQELILEIRCPGRTHRLLVSAEIGVGRLHLVPRRPPRNMDGGETQSRFRRCLTGRPLVGLRASARLIEVATPDFVLQANLAGGLLSIRPAEEGEGTPVPELAGEGPQEFPISEAVRVAHERLVPARRAEALRTRIDRELGRRQKKLEGTAAKVRRDVERLEEHRVSGGHGELLKSALHQVQRGAASVKVMDWTTGAELEVPLDPAKSAKDNLEQLFRRAKKANRGLPVARARLTTLERELASLVERRQAILTATVGELEALAESGRRSGAVASGRARAKKSEPLDRVSRRFQAADGTEIRVGKDAKGSDALTRSARGYDLWLHVRGDRGAHVVVRLGRNMEPAHETFLDAAHLAIHYSRVKAEAKAEILYAEARHVSRRKGDPPGLVSVARGKTMMVAVDPSRMSRLLAQLGS